MATPTTGRLRRWGPSLAVTVLWLLGVVAFGQLGRVAEHGESALTMLAGSFLAGSSPEGGGAVAFPVFTKALGVPTPVARTFGLTIQAVGMSMAVVAIVRAGRPFHRRAAAVGSLAAIVGLLVAAVALGRPDEPFWPSIVPTPWVKATFSIVLATTSLLMLRQLRLHRGVDHEAELAVDPDRNQGEHRWTGRTDLALVVVAGAGGVLSSLTGTGANILVFLLLVVVAGVLPKTALPTAIMVMAAVSVVGFVVHVGLDGQFDLTRSGDRVTAVAGLPVDLPTSGGDLFGLWLAAVPVVVWGAPLGSLAASLVREHHLVRFVALLAAVEVVTTFVLVPELWTEPALLTYLLVGLVALPVAFVAAARSGFLVGAAEHRTSRVG
ncbi:MAG: TSUP family transporter [Actinomycetota bacterium]